MPKSDWCRKNMDRIKDECYGGELSPETMRDARTAIEFTKRAPILALQSTLSVNTVRTIKDPIIQGKVLEMIKDTLESGSDPRTGDKFRRKSGAFCITLPMIKWMRKYAETGERPAYSRRGENKPTQLDIIALKVLFTEILNSKKDRRTGEYPVSAKTMDNIRAFNEVLCKAVSR